MYYSFTTLRKEVGRGGRDKFTCFFFFFLTQRAKSNLDDMVVMENDKIHWINISLIYL